MTNELLSEIFTLKKEAVEVRMALIMGYTTGRQLDTVNELIYLINTIINEIDEVEEDRHDAENVANAVRYAKKLKTECRAANVPFSIMELIDDICFKFHQIDDILKEPDKPDLDMEIPSSMLTVQNQTFVPETYVKVVEVYNDIKKYCDEVNELIKQGYAVSSTNCHHHYEHSQDYDESIYQAILLYVGLEG